MQNINVNIVPDNYPQTINFSQGDIGRQFKINVTDFEIPVGATVKIQATKPSGFGFSVAGTVSDNSVTFTTTEEMTDEAGRFQAELQITSGGDVIGTANFLMVGERNPHPEGTTDGSQGTIIPELTLLVERVEKAASDILDMEVVATTLPAGSQATYSYDEDLNKATFGIPEGQAGAGAAGVVASAYSAAKTYKVGDYVLYNSNLYRCTTAITTAEAWTAAHWTQVVLADDVSDLKTDLRETEAEITGKMTKVESKNLIDGAIDSSDFTSGYMGADGRTYSSDTYVYTKRIQVSEGDVLRVYGGSPLVLKSVRFITAFNENGEAVPEAGDETGTGNNPYTVPSGIASVVFSIYTPTTPAMITKNYEATVYEPYFTPYYIASEDFVANVLDNFELPTEPIKGTNLINAYEVGDGFYDRSGGKATKYNYSGYKYAKIPIKQNTWYYFSFGCRTLLLCDDNDNVLTYYGNDLSPLTRRIVNSGNATIMYYTASSGAFSGLTIVSEGIDGVNTLVKKPSFISGLTQRMHDARYGNALPKVPLYFTVGIDEEWYYKNMLALKSNIPFLIMGGGIDDTKGIIITRDAESFASNNYGYAIYDENLAIVDEKDRNNGGYQYTKSDNLQNASILYIGDSTTAQMMSSGKITDGFDARSKTVTFIGTRGIAPNNHEGRSGWSAKAYCTESARDTVTNAFWNPSTEKFDFSYYMTENSFSAPDFVIIQLGINDLYGTDFDFANSQTKIEETANYLLEMIDSILAYNSSQKILLNLPTAINEDQSKNTQNVILTRNKFVRYNELMQALASTYSMDIVRCSYCHLILDPEEDISDDVHPKTQGYEKMANEIINQINCWQNA